ncbi:hypothetical protein HO133_004765 [Letharia lupina]|uniref:Uncharacterized protein n=1 Tax=Letharia lupina TaxID=560253 RepID=A0A8H6FKY0_9LECA|nr:uncharacterized protein HO133_004765 [Letharia lupina]KAF6230423.1 hypothetical protein HO133_004765 [Letharia lupina]
MEAKLLLESNIHSSTPSDRWGGPLLEDGLRDARQDLSSGRQTALIRPSVYHEHCCMKGSENRDDDTIRQAGTAVADDESGFDRTRTLVGTGDLIWCLNQERRVFSSREGIVDNWKWAPHQDLEEIPFNTTTRLFLPSRSLNDGTGLENVEETFEQRIESVVREMDLISTQRTCASEKNPRG